MVMPDGVQIELLSQYFEGLSYPLRRRNREHKLTGLIVICARAILSGAKWLLGM